MEELKLPVLQQFKPTRIHCLAGEFDMLNQNGLLSNSTWKVWSWDHYSGSEILKAYDHHHQTVFLSTYEQLASQNLRTTFLINFVLYHLGGIFIHRAVSQRQIRVLMDYVHQRNITSFQGPELTYNGLGDNLIFLSLLTGSDTAISVDVNKHIVTSTQLDAFLTSLPGQTYRLEYIAPVVGLGLFLAGWLVGRSQK